MKNARFNISTKTFVENGIFFFCFRIQVRIGEKGVFAGNHPWQRAEIFIFHEFESIEKMKTFAFLLLSKVEPITDYYTVTNERCFQLYLSLSLSLSLTNRTFYRINYLVSSEDKKKCPINTRIQYMHNMSSFHIYSHGFLCVSINYYRSYSARCVLLVRHFQFQLLCYSHSSRLFADD